MRDCYDYDAAVLFNACAGELWRRFTTYLPRRLARLAGITQKQLRQQVAVRYVKVAEYQARGVVHYHAVIRLDAARRRTTSRRRPATTLTCCARPSARPPLPSAWSSAPKPITRTSRPCGWASARRPTPGRSATSSTGQQLTVQAVANYIAKYATKTLTAPGLPDHRLRSAEDIEALSCSRHYQQMITTCLAARPTVRVRRALRKWAHMLGFGGHFLTKSRRYSVTFGQLRKARTEHRRAQHHPDGERDPWGRPLDETVVLVLGTWTVTGTGYPTNAEADLAMAAAARAREHEPWSASAA